MTTKMKGLLKGLRYISQIFDDGKEQEMQIGFPTDVKHVAHIGWDGPSVDSPSWMKEFKSPSGFQSAPLLSSPMASNENDDIKWVSDDSSTRSGRRSPHSPAKNIPGFSKSSRRQSSADIQSPAESPSGDLSTSSRRSRRNSSKESLDGTKSSSHRSHDLNLGFDSPTAPKGVPEIPKKTHRKKSKESMSGGASSRYSRSKGDAVSGSNPSQFLDPGFGPVSAVGSNNSDDICLASRLKKPLEQYEGNESSGFS